ncbi:MAG: hypothetical protein K9K67_08400 [Bacteriovoracaceae bacterium]|nr:hypothetical protein [Bacteriovoracaceae bacterium]
MNKDRLATFAFLIFLLIYLFQQFGRREDWPFTFFGMYKGGRFDTKPFYHFKVLYKDDSQFELNAYSFKVDFFFLDEKIRSILLGFKEDFNNDVIAVNERISEDKENEVKEFLLKNVKPLLDQQCENCKKGEISLHISYWDEMVFENYLKPDRSWVYTSVPYGK